MTTLREGQKATIKANTEAIFFDDEGRVTDYFRRLLDDAIDHVLIGGNHTLEEAEGTVRHFKCMLSINHPLNMTLRTK